MKQVYHIQLNWRHLDYYLRNPKSPPAGTDERAPFKPRHIAFLPANQITDVNSLRDYLYDAGLDYYLVGSFNGAFQGINVVFNHIDELAQFREHWKY